LIMDAWWERYPTEFSKEKEALEALGYAWSIDAAAMETGQLVVLVEVPHGKGVLLLTASYPDTYPYFPPMVTTDSGLFSRHQHPLGRNLCLLARDGEDWRPGHDSLATLIKEQLPAILEVNDSSVGSEAVAQAEDHVGEPLSSFLLYAMDCAVVVPDETPPADIRSGRLGLLMRAVPSGRMDRCFVNGVVTSMSDMHNRPLVTFTTTVPSFAVRSNGFWLRLDKRPQVSSFETAANDVFNLIAASLPELGKAISSAKRGDVIVVGLVFPDEVSWRHLADDWVFLAVCVTREAKRSRAAGVRMDFVRADWGGQQAWLRRAPFLTPMRDKAALVVGLGSLGAPVCLQLSGAGIGRLELVDFDNLQVGNTVRWPLGWQYAGFQKTGALAAHIANEYPYTTVNEANLRIGIPRGPGGAGSSDYEILRRMATEADIVVDAAASHRVSHFLADLAREIEKPYIWLTTTHGAAGGIVGRVRPTRSQGCWHCFLRDLADQTIGLPTDAGTDEIQPGGCSQPTFIGAGIDSSAISNLAARLTVATLCSGAENGYLDFSWDVAVADIQREGLPIAPEWTTYDLSVRQDCPDCSAKA
jgi:molybdopterin/thiamine biosynthesis adenylyltransferase